MMLRKLSIVLLVICFIITMSGCSKKQEVTTVEEVDLSHESKTIEAFGTVKAEESKDVVIDFESVVTDVLVKEGQHVALNEPILTLDLSKYLSQINDNKIELNIAKLEQESAIKSLQTLTMEDSGTIVNKLKNDLEYANKLCVQVEGDFKSKEILFNEGAISQDAFNQAKQELEKAKNNAANLELELKSAEKSYSDNVKQFQTDKETVKNNAEIQTERIKQIENNLALLENKLNKPFIIKNQVVSDYSNAAVFDIQYTDGHITDASKKAFTIVNLDSLIIEANVAEEFIKDIKIGSQVKIVPVADRTKEYTGSVVNISQMAFENKGETVVPVRIAINDLDSFLLPNYNVDVYIDTE